MSLFGFIGLKSKELQEPAGFSASALPIHLGADDTIEKRGQLRCEPTHSPEKRESAATLTCPCTHPIFRTPKPRPKTHTSNIDHAKRPKVNTAYVNYLQSGAFSLCIPGSSSRTPENKNKNHPSRDRNQNFRAKIERRKSEPQDVGPRTTHKTSVPRPAAATAARRKRHRLTDRPAAHIHILAYANRPTHLLHY